MDTIQESFLLLDLHPKLDSLPLFQRYALILHSINL